jgi:aspartate/methionine/tyrosine aminotransferase
MRDRTITISGASKTFSGDRLAHRHDRGPRRRHGDAIRKVHDFLTVGAPAPLQEAAPSEWSTLGRDYYEGLARDYRRRRDVMCEGLRAAGFSLTPPQGAYYVLADFSALSDLPDTQFAVWLTKEIGVAPVPGSSFYSKRGMGRRLVRFAFCKTEPMLREAVTRLAGVRSRV